MQISSFTMNRKKIHSNNDLQCIIGIVFIFIFFHGYLQKLWTKNTLKKTNKMDSNIVIYLFLFVEKKIYYLLRIQIYLNLFE